MHNNIALSPIDHVFTGVGAYPIEFVFSYKSKIDENQLRKSLKETFAYFKPACSRLVKISDVHYGFDDVQDGYHFEAITSDVSFNETDERAIFIDPVNSVEGAPLTRVRLTQTPSGSVLGVSISHAVADGFSYFYFLTSWANLFHGKKIYPPSHQRDLLKRTSQMDTGLITKEDIVQATGLFLDTKRQALSRDDLVWETINLSNEELSGMLEEAQRDCSERLSMNDVVTAMLGRKFIPQWMENSDASAAYISCPVDFRRLLDGFPGNYFGNAVSLATTNMSIEQLTQSNPVDLALKVRAKIASVGKDYIFSGMKMLRQLTDQQGLEINEHIHVAHPQSGLLVTNLSRLPVPEVQFNAGPPDAYEILTPAQRGAVVLPAKDGIEIRVCTPCNQ